MSHFTHLHVHTHYSLLDGLGKVPEVLDKAKELGMDSVAITDHGVMYGVVEFYKEAKERGIKPIVGCEVYIAPRTLHDKTPRIDGSPHHLVLLAKNKKGYLNLIELVTIANLEGYYYKPRIDKEVLVKYSEGLIALSSCLHGEIPAKLMANDKKGALKSLEYYKKVFGKDFYIELQHHPGFDEQEKANKLLIKLAKENKISLVATKDVHYVEKDDSEAHDALLCVQTGKLVSDKNRMSFEGDQSFVSQEEMIEAFKDTPEAIKNTQEIAKKCNLELKLGDISLPRFEPPKGYTLKTYLEKLVNEGIKKRYKTITKEIEERKNFELSVIERMKYESYFLIIADFINWAKNKGIIVGPGRGSAAGSIIAYALNITDLNPIKYGLLFERFLNPERISMPDIDMDFADDRRSEVIDYVVEKYGENHVAQIITFGTMAARNAIRDTGRVLGMSYSEVDQIAKVTPSNMHLKESIKEIPDLRSFYESDERIKKLLDLATRLEGVARHASTHAAGVVISKEPLKCYVPLQKATKGDIGVITQYSMGPLEDVGLLKMDFLGLANLTILKNTLRIIEKVYGKKIDLENIPLDDKKTYKLLSRGETTGVFQLESAGMKRTVRKLKPTVFEDLVALCALYRPGPMQFIDDFIRRKHGQAEIEYIHPTMEDALKNTYGIIVYQEQVMQISKDMCGFTGGQADTLRKAIGKKIPKLMKKMRKEFIDGAIKNKVSKKLAEKIFTALEDFAAYAFNKSHAACYALIAYQTAYLKTYYPDCFMAALMTSDYGDIDKIAIEVEECKRMNIEVLPPDVNESFAEFGIIPGTKKIRFGMMAIKNIGHGIIEAIVEAREKDGKFKSIDDFAKRVESKQINKKVLESLTKCGAMNLFGKREDLLLSIEKILQYSSQVQHHYSNGQIDLFGNSGIELPSLALEKAKEEINMKEKLSWEKQLLGLYVSQHPLDEYQDKLDSKFTKRIGLVEKVGKDVFIAGVITQVKRVLTRNKELMLFVKLEDRTGSVETIVFPKILKKNSTIWQEDKVVVVKGRVNTKDESLKVLCDEVFEIEKALKGEIKGMKINKTQNMGHEVQRAKADNDFKPNSKIIQLKIPKSISQEDLKKAKQLLFDNQGDLPIEVSVPNNGGYKKVRLPFNIDFNSRLKKEIEELLGKEAFYS